MTNNLLFADLHCCITNILPTSLSTLKSADVVTTSHRDGLFCYERISYREKHDKYIFKCDFTSINFCVIIKKIK